MVRRVTTLENHSDSGRVYCFSANVATVYSLNNVQQMYVPFDFALESEILNCSIWILPRETRETKDAMKCILGFLYQNFLYSLTQKATSFPAGIYQLKVNNRNTRARYDICSNLTIKTPKRYQWHK